MSCSGNGRENVLFLCRLFIIQENCEYKNLMHVCIILCNILSNVINDNFINKLNEEELIFILMPFKHCYKFKFDKIQCQKKVKIAFTLNSMEYLIFEIYTL